jgi:hypothetical protein
LTKPALPAGGSVGDPKDQAYRAVCPLSTAHQPDSPASTDSPTEAPNVGRTHADSENKA